MSTVAPAESSVGLQSAWSDGSQDRKEALEGDGSNNGFCERFGSGVSLLIVMFVFGGFIQCIMHGVGAHYIAAEVTKCGVNNA